MTSAGDEALIRSVTELASTTLVPEVRLHLMPPRHPLWRATPEEAAAAGLVMPFWAFAWPGGQALARWVLDHSEAVRGRRVLDVGCGGAIEGIAALQAGAVAVTCADVDPLAVRCAQLNAQANGLTLATTTDDLLEVPAGALACDLVLVGDLTFDEAITSRLVPWLRAHRALGRDVLVGDAGRVPLPEDFVELGAHEAPFDGGRDGSTSWRISIRSLRSPGE